MDKSTTPITGYGFAKRIVDYYGTNTERGAGDVLLDEAAKHWCDWLEMYDSFYQNPLGKDNKERFDEIIKDICALYNTRGGVVIIGIDQHDPILKNRGLQDYAKKSCDQMCKHNTLLCTKDEKRKIKRLFERKIVCFQGHESIALLVKSAEATGMPYSIGNDTNQYYVRDERKKKSRLAVGVTTANSVMSDEWEREDYLNRGDLKQKLIELNIPFVPSKHIPIGKVLANVLRRNFSAKELFSALIRCSRLGFVIMTLLQFLPICYEVCRYDNDLTVSHGLKTFIIGIIPFVAPYWAAQGTIHAWGQSVIVSYLVYFWPYILYASASLFTVVDWVLVKRETLVKIGKCVVLLAAVSICVGFYMGYVSFRNRIKSIGGYEVFRKDIVPAIGLNELIIRSVEAVEFEAGRKYSEAQPRDIYGAIKQADPSRQIGYLQMLRNGLMRVEAMYIPIEGKRTKWVETFGEPDQGLIDCLSALSEAVNECIKCHSYRSDDFDKMWQKVNITNRNFFERAKEIGIYSKGA